MSPRWNWDSPTALAASECALPPGPKGGGANSPVAKGVGESQFQRLEKRLALCLLCVFNDQTDQGDETDGFEGEGIRGEGIWEGGYEASIHCWRLTSETSRFTVPPAVELRELYEKRYTLADFSLGLFAGFSLNIINFAGRISEAVILASVVHWKDPLGPILEFFAGFLCILLISPEVLAKLWAMGEEYYIITHRWLSGKNARV